jgi:RHS repeat-associated protein
MDLLLKSQSSTGTGSGTLEVWYDPVSDYVSVWSYESSQGWVRHGAFIPATFANGDVLGARATADGMVYVYKNGVLLGGRDVTDWTYYANGGYIGLWFLDAADAVADDFGGGDLTESRSGGSYSPPEKGETDQPSPLPVSEWLKKQSPVKPTSTPVKIDVRGRTNSAPRALGLGKVQMSILPAQSSSPLSLGVTEVITVIYGYDPLNRLTEAETSDGTYFDYTYDSVGNRLMESTQAGTTNYGYDIANRLTSMGGVTYTWDANGNLLSDGVNTYSYTNNKLSSITGNNLNAAIQYNGLGNRVSQTVNGVTTNYVLDQAGGLTQVLADGTNTYLYGNGRIGEKQPGGFMLHLSDALGSVRQLVDSSGTVTLSQNYEPYGRLASSTGDGSSMYGFTGEQFDSHTELIYLRARMYSPITGRFTTKDTWMGNYTRPLSLNGWNYVEANPVNYLDPLGLCAGCFLFYFSGIGNLGDLDNNGFGITDLDTFERRFLTQLEARSGVTVKPIYPYAVGNGGNTDISANQLLVFLAANSGAQDITSAKMREVLAYLKDTPAYQYLSTNGCSDLFKNKIDGLNITFLGYSGGGQIAYSTAQDLKGRLFVDNLVLMGAAYLAYNGVSNIGHIWELWGEYDLYGNDLMWGGSAGGNLYKLSGWDLLNEGYRGISIPIYTPSQDIYRHGATRCIFQNGNQPYVHYNSYMNRDETDSGVTCSLGGTYQRDAQSNLSRMEAMISFLINVVGIGRGERQR